MTTEARSGHPSSCFSATEILVALYFGKVLDIVLAILSGRAVIVSSSVKATQHRYFMQF